MKWNGQIMYPKDYERPPSLAEVLTALAVAGLILYVIASLLGVVPEATWAKIDGEAMAWTFWSAL